MKKEERKYDRKSMGANKLVREEGMSKHSERMKMKDVLKD